MRSGRRTNIAPSPCVSAAQELSGAVRKSISTHHPAVEGNRPKARSTFAQSGRGAVRSKAPGTGSNAAERKRRFIGKSFSETDGFRNDCGAGRAFAVRKTQEKEHAVPK